MAAPESLLPTHTGRDTASCTGAEWTGTGTRDHKSLCTACDHSVMCAMLLWQLLLSSQNSEWGSLGVVVSHTLARHIST